MKTISLKLAKKIHKAADKKGVELPRANKWYPMLDKPDRSQFGCHYYSTDELLEMLPLGISIDKHWNRYSVSTPPSLDILHYESATTPSEALGKMLYYLIENDLYPNNPKQ